jgi:ABC-2 type transport system permease protein
VLIAVGFALGWNPDPHGSGSASAGAIVAVLLATAGFGGIGLFMAGVLKAEVNLAAANGLYLVLLLLGGMVVPVSKLPGGVADVAKVLPSEALSAALHATLGTGSAVPTLSWVVLAVWAVAAPTAAALSFRWE